MKLTSVWRWMVLSSALTTTPGPASPPMASIETVRARVTATFSRRGPLALGLHDFAVGIMTAGTADMMRALGFAAIGAIAMGGCRQGVMRAAHVAARRRGFSFRDRHGGRLLQAQALRPFWVPETARQLKNHGPGHPGRQNRRRG